MWLSMRATYYPIFPVLWLVLNVVIYLTTPHTRASMIFFALMIGVGLIAMVYFCLLAYAPRVLAGLFGGSRCPVCYAKLNDTGFCPKCGTIVDSEAGMTVCQKCGNRIDGTDRDFCPRCGSMLKK